jgi:tetraacyldisaccharide 4'-kinase
VRSIESIWTGDSATSIATRSLLLPFAALYRAGSGVRNWMYDRALFASDESRIPVVSVGNISVGGTGKTPFAAWIARQLTERGASPAVILRGYGGDEAQVHRLLNPNVRIMVSPSRIDGIRRAAEKGADLAVLDDAFQHRRARRDEDVVLVSADAWTDTQRILPAGPWREPLSALNRASLIVIARKAAGTTRVDAASEAIRRAAPSIPQATLRFGLDKVHRVSRAPGKSGIAAEATTDLGSFTGKSVIAVAAIGDPDAFFAQLEQRGVSVERAAFPDHHQFTVTDVDNLARRAARVDGVLCTLKDAVKLGELWPPTATSLWYVSQSIVLESGASEIEQLLTRIYSLTGQRDKRETTQPYRPQDQTPT